MEHISEEDQKPVAEEPEWVMPSQVLSLGVEDNLSRLQGDLGEGLCPQTRA